MTDRLPNGSTANISPQVISHGPSLALGGVQTMSARRPPELLRAASTPGYFRRIESAIILPMADPCRRRADRLAALCPRLVDLWPGHARRAVVAGARAPRAPPP